MKELDEMEKINTKLSLAVEDLTLEHVKKNEVTWLCCGCFLPTPLSSFVGLKI
jgi:hypothetical protein